MVDNQLQRANGRSAVQVRIGNNFYDAVRVAGCHTCTHPARAEIEERIIQGYSFKSVSGQYSDVDWEQKDGTSVHLPLLSWKSIFNHFKAGHTPVEAAAMDEIIQRRAQSIGITQYEEQTQHFVDHYTFAQNVLRRSQERLVRGEIEPEIKDGIAAAKLLQDVEKSSQTSVDAEAWSEAMQRYFEVAQKIMPPTMWEHFTRTLATDPILLSISKRVEQNNTIEAEVVEPHGKD